MRYIEAIAASVMMASLVIVAIAATDPPSRSLSPSERISYSDLICSATILDNQLTGKTLPLGSLTLAENLAQAGIDSVFKGKSNISTIFFRWYSWPAPEDPHIGSSGFAYAGPPLAHLATHTRFLLFLRGNPEQGWQVTVPGYQLEVRLAPTPGQNLQPLFDSSLLKDAERNLELAQEFASAAHYFEPFGGAANVSEYFSWMDQLLGADAIPFIRPFLQSATIRLRYFAADRLALMKNDEGKGALLETLADPDFDALNRANAASDLGKLHSKDILPDLEKYAMGDPKPVVREGAIRGLSEIADVSSAKVLVRVLDDPVEMNRIYAANTLEKIMLGRTYAITAIKDHESEIIASWKLWLIAGGPPPNYAALKMQ